MTVLPHILLGATWGFAAAVQPGQFQAYLISETLANGWRRTVPVTLAPLVSDLPAITLVLLVLTRVPPLFVHVLQVVGGLFVLYLAAGAVRTSRRPAGAVQAGPAPVHRTIVKAALLNVLNPNPYIAWALVLGPLLLSAWSEAPAHAAAFLTSFYLAMVAAAAGIVVLFGAARSIGPRVARMLVAASAFALGAFGVYQLWAGARALLGA